jgi:tetratricopeptide (TPR) repeat protein
MPDVPRLARRLLAEWPLVAAAAALLSLLWLPRFMPSRASLEEAAVARLRDLHLRNDLEGVEGGASAFLRDAPDSAFAGEVHALRGRAALKRIDANPAFGAQAWSELSAARRAGFRPAEMARLQRDSGHALLDRGRSAEAAEAFRELIEVDPAARLDLGRALAARAARRPAEAEALTREILELAATSHGLLPPERKIDAVLAAARLARRAGRAEDALPVLIAAIQESPADRGLLQLERGRTLASLDRKAEALAAMDLADELLKDQPATRTARVLAQLELRARAGLPDAPALAETLDTPAARRLGHVLTALWRLGLDRSRGLYELSDALGEFRSLRDLEEDGMDLPWIKRSLRAAARVEDDPSSLARAAGALGRLHRLEPEDVELLLDRAAALRRIGDLLKPVDATAAAARFAEAGEAFDQASVSEGLDLLGQERASREGAEAYVKADRFAPAARLYRRWHEFGPRRNAEGLLLQARALRKARLPAAADVYGEYASRAKPGDPGLPEALLERGRLRAELGDLEGALTEFDRLLTEDLGVSPDAAEWEAALLERGRTLLELGRTDKARRALAEYLERYATAGEVRAGASEASYLLGRAAMEQRDWEGALEALERAVSADPADERTAAIQREARFLRGDLFFALGRYDDAERAYAEASRRHAGSPDRLWGVVGRARALAKLGRLEEARREARTGRALYDEGKDALETSFSGRGKTYWTAALEILEKEVR